MAFAWENVPLNRCSLTAPNRGRFRLLETQFEQRSPKWLVRCRQESLAVDSIEQTLRFESHPIDRSRRQPAVSAGTRLR